MAARVRDAKLDSPTARAKLPARGKPYFKAIGQGLHLGYRKGQSSGKWVARVYTGAGGYIVETIATTDDQTDADGRNVLTFYQAQERARDAQTRLTGTRAALRPFTVEDALAEYVAHLEHKAKPTGDAKNRIKNHIIPALGHIEVAKLTAKQVRTWMKAIADAPPRNRGKNGSDAISYRQTAGDEEAKRRRRASTNRTLTVLKAALNRAWREGKVVSDKEWRSVEPFEGADAARVRYLQVVEAQRLINGCEPSFRKLVQAALQTGCRYGELCRLKVEDFNADAGTLTIRRSKSGKARHVILTSEGADFFRQLVAGRAGRELLLRNELRLARSDRRGADDIGDWRPSEQVRAMAEACKRAKIDPPIGFHGLRHTWASLAVMAGVPLMVVARNLGHADTRMVERHYGHLSQSYMVDAIRAGAPRFGAVKHTNVSALA
jgi:integrase